jgi:hypothetical protein
MMTLPRGRGFSELFSGPLDVLLQTVLAPNVHVLETAKNELAVDGLRKRLLPDEKGVFLGESHVPHEHLLLLLRKTGLKRFTPPVGQVGLLHDLAPETTLSVLVKERTTAHNPEILDPDARILQKHPLRTPGNAMRVIHKPAQIVGGTRRPARNPLNLGIVIGRPKTHTMEIRENLDQTAGVVQERRNLEGNPHLFSTKSRYADTKPPESSP